MLIELAIGMTPGEGWRWRPSGCAAMVLVTGFSLLGLPTPAHAGPFDSFTGSYSARGTIVEGPRAETHDVRCSFASSSQGAAGFGLRGRCWAYLVVSRSISADLILDPRSSRVTGTYAGARVGIARLNGRQRGNVISLSIMWPAPVFGNLKSAMTIKKVDSDHLRIVVMSRIGVDGPVRTTTDLLLQRQ